MQHFKILYCVSYDPQTMMIPLLGQRCVFFSEKVGGGREVLPSVVWSDFRCLLHLGLRNTLR